MLKIHLCMLALGWLTISAYAQTPVVMSPHMAAERDADTVGVRREAQPPEQSGQAQQMMKEARVELERAAVVLGKTEANEHRNAVLIAQGALVQFEESLGQLHQSVPGYVPLTLATSLHEQVSQTLVLLESDTAAAASSMHELAVRVTDLTAEADLLIGKTLLAEGQEKLGMVSNVLITADGRIQALIVDRAAPSKNSQFTVEWDDVTIVGSTLVAGLSVSEAESLPSYVAGHKQ